MAKHPSKTCFHCHNAIAPGVFIAVQRTTEAVDHVCCYGCKAVAELILGQGLGRFYQYLDTPLPRPDEVSDAQDMALSVYDRDDLLAELAEARLVKASDGSEKTLLDIRLSIRGITCAACVWLIENAMRTVPGVESCLVNLGSHEAQLEWYQDEVPLSTLLSRMRRLGYEAIPLTAEIQEAELKKNQRTDLLRIGIAGIGAMQAMMLAIPTYFGMLDVSGETMLTFFRMAALFIATPVVFFSAQPFFAGAKRSLINTFRTRQVGQLTMEVPVALAMALAYGSSLMITWQGGDEVYFDSVCMFTFFLLLGRFFENKARLKMVHESARLSQQRFVLYERLDSATLRLKDQVLVRDMQVGDVIRLGSGQLIPFDGEICSTDSTPGQSYHVNEAALTGEFRPQRKRPGDSVLSGSVVVDTPVPARVVRVGSDSFLSTVDRLVNRALSERPAVARLADRVGGIFVFGVLVVTSLVFAFWYWYDPDAPLRAFEIALSVLVVTCPCALALATPTALTSATNALRRLGLIVTRGHTIETMARVDTIVFDKTGTLTYGHLSLRSEIDPVQLQLAADLAAHSEHPVSRALAKAAEGHSTSRLQAGSRFEAVRVVPGSGVEGKLDGVVYRLGNAEFVAELLRADSLPQSDGEHTEAWLVGATSPAVCTRFEFDDEIRPESPEVISRFNIDLHHDCRMMSGDRPGPVHRVAEALGIRQALAGCSPDDKLAAVQRLQDDRVVAMIGDGINDLPAMAAAHVSIAMHEASDLAQVKADALLGAGRLAALPAAFLHARKTLKIIRQNLGWALGYNAIALPLAMAGLVPPWAAAIGMSLSSLIVVFNAMRLNRISPA